MEQSKKWLFDFSVGKTEIISFYCSFYCTTQNSSFKILRFPSFSKFDEDCCIFFAKTASKKSVALICLIKVISSKVGLLVLHLWHPWNGWLIVLIGFYESFVTIFRYDKIVSWCSKFMYQQLLSWCSKTLELFAFILRSFDLLMALSLELMTSVTLGPFPVNFSKWFLSLSFF